MTTPDGEWWGCKCLCLQIDVSFYFPKMPSPRIAFIFFQKRPYVSWNCLFVFHKCPFVFQKCLCVSQKMFYSFPESLFSIPEKSSLYLLWVLFFKNGFFQLIVPSPCPTQSCSDRWYLLCCCFVSPWNSLLTNLWCLLDNLNSSTWSMIFCVFHLNFSFHDSLENTVS